MDTFAERLIARAQNRRSDFQKHLQTMDDSGESEEDQYKAIINTHQEIVVKRNKRASSEDKENSTKGKVQLSQGAHERLQKLSALYSDETPGPSSPIYKPHDRFSPSKYHPKYEEPENTHSAVKDRLSEARSQRLAALARVINDWEDQSDKKVHFKTKEKVTKIKPILKESTPPAQSQKYLRPTEQTPQDDNKTLSSQKKVGWDRKMITSLEAQGYQRCDSEQHLVFDYKSPKHSPAKCSTSERNGISPIKLKLKNEAKNHSNESSTDKTITKTTSAERISTTQHKTAQILSKCINFERERTSPIKTLVNKEKDLSPTRRFVSPKGTNNAVMELAAKYEDGSPTKKMKDPTELSIMDRKALFEKNKGGAILPKAPFGMPVPAKALIQSNENTPKAASKINNLHTPKIKTEWLKVTPKNEWIKDTPTNERSKITPTNERSKITPTNDWHKVTPNSDNPRDAVNEAIRERHREIEELKNRWEKKRVALPISQSSPNNNKGEEKMSHCVPKPPPMPKKSSPSKRIWMHTLTPIKEENINCIPKSPMPLSVFPTKNEQTLNLNEKEENCSVFIPIPPPMPPSLYSCYESNQKHRLSLNPVEEASPIPKPPPMPQTSPKRIRMGTLSPVRASHNVTFSPIEREYESVTNRKNSRKSLEDYTGSPEVKPIRVSPPKPGRLYPSVSDIETESEIQSSDFDNRESEREYSTGSDESSIVSFGQAIVEASRISRTSLKRQSTSSESTISSENVSAQESRIIHEMDDFLDEALGGASPPKKSRNSYENEIPPMERRMSSHPSGSTRCDSFEFSTDSNDDESANKKEVALVHSVSMYRKLGTLTTPVRKEIRHEPHREEQIKKNNSIVPEEVLVKERIKELECEMVKQTTIISQASQALNLCHSKIEFSGSPEQVEAEKLLLLATSRRTAAVHEIERLKVEKKLKPGNNLQDTERGDLTIDHITLPIKPVTCSMEKVDNFVCLASSGASVLATQCLPANRRETRLMFTKPLKFEQLYPDFTVSLEVYRLSTAPSSEFIPHEVKYGISQFADRKKDKLRMTPQKKGTRTQRVIESPAGPNAVRSPAFQLVGFAVFSLREVNRTKFTLSKVPYGAPIEGSLELKMTTQLKTDLVYKGFLTLFEEVSGFGAWRRRWGVLSGTVISLWAYPEHEQEKIPIDTIDLSQCHNKEIGLVSRDICARPHTFLLDIIGGTRYLMSADSVEDRLGWCKAINKSLYLLSAWGNLPKL